jgi:small subunit ribosomal protein S17
MTDTGTIETKARRGFRRKLVGTVTSDKMDKTVTVEVIRRYLAPLYKKYVRTRRRYQAHDAQNEYRIGDRVEIQEARPLSKRKRWVVTRMIAASAEREEG